MNINQTVSQQKLIYLIIKSLVSRLTKKKIINFFHTNKMMIEALGLNTLICNVSNSLTRLLSEKKNLGGRNR